MKKLVLIFTTLLTLLLQAILILLWLHCMYLWCKMLKFLFSTHQGPPLDLNLKQMIQFTLPNPFSSWHVHNLRLLSVPLMRYFSEYFAYISYLSCVCYMSYPFTSLDLNIPRTDGEYRWWSLIMNCFSYICYFLIHRPITLWLVLQIDQRALFFCAGAVSCGWGLSPLGHIFTISWQRVIGR